MSSLHLFLSFPYKVYRGKGGQNQLLALMFVKINLIKYDRLCGYIS